MQAPLQARPEPAQLARVSELEPALLRPELAQEPVRPRRAQELAQEQRQPARAWALRVLV